VAVSWAASRMPSKAPGRPRRLPITLSMNTCSSVGILTGESVCIGTPSIESLALITM
jgi:hypothetical protein